ncbi:ubiquitin-conjugating enzyme E2C-binding protein [Xylaria palmicola]|nr:ubiquitin-conjugating enzyme E2C-binding protein [Xylaria palmicola]
MPPSQRILIYAELLPNIRQISVGCTLPSPISEATRASVATDGKALTVTHGGLSETIRLPESVAPFPQLPVGNSGAAGLSWRLPLATALGGRVRSASEELVPWSATDLEPGSAVECRTCKLAIVGAGTLKVWKDLPSENWAEMMEFWHCHKPHKQTPHHDEEHLTNRGYGASSRIATQPGVGFVDLTSFLLAESDLATSLAPLGVRNDHASSVSVFKWQVLVKERSRNIPALLPTLAQCVSAMLLATMARSGCSKSILLPMKPQATLSQDRPESESVIQTRGLLNLWVFNANITFSSTEAPESPAPAIKLFYRIISEAEADRLLESITSDVQEISLHSDAIQNITEILNKSNSFIPDGDRQFKEWTVGLLAK